MEEIKNGLRGVIKFILFSLIILTFLLWSFVCHFLIRNPGKRLSSFSRNSQFFSRLCLKVFNLDLKVINKPSEQQKFLLVSNHMGFVDILMLASCSPLVFVTSVEMRETPFLGLLTEMGGCIYVERRSRTRILAEMHNIVDSLKKGFRVALYPEATSTNGEQVLPFKRTLLMAAAHAEVPIQPVVVNFRKINGEEFSLKWRDHVCWYGDIPFLTSMWKSAILKSVTAEIEFLEPITVGPSDDRATVADKAHAVISSKFRPVKVMSEVDP
ncbi:MAG: lysophospholipid acyltransferase family protein [Pseudobdellovibrionaceae bacterium]